MDTLLIDSDRQSNPPPSCGIFVRARTPEGEFVSADLSLLERASLELWLESDVGRARRTVLHLLGHY